MKTNDQVAGEAREKLASKIENAVFAQRLQGEDSITLTASFSQWKEVITALRAQPERGAEEMREPPPGLLMSMALRYDHGLGVPGYYDQEIFKLTGGATHARRLESTLSTMRQLWEEVTGNGFYKPAAEADYAARLDKLRALPLHPAKDEGGGR